MSGTQETINETMQVMHAVPLSPYDDKSKRGPYLRSESGDVCDFYFFSLTEHGQRDKMILHPNAHEKAERLAACWNYCRGIPTAAMEGDGVRAAIEEARQRFNVVKEIAYKLPNKCECSGSVACVCCNLLADIGDLDEALSRIDAALAGGEKR